MTLHAYIPYMESLMVELFRFVHWRLQHGTAQIEKINSPAGGFHIYRDVYRWRDGKTEYQLWTENEDEWICRALELQETESLAKSM